MIRLQLTIFLLLLPLALSACNHRRGRSLPTDSGTSASNDGGIFVGVDMGTTPIDMGTTPIDMGTVPECFTSSDCGAGENCFSGSCVNDPSVLCVDERISAVSGAYCAVATDTCIQGCADSACVDACLNADPDPAGCNGCLNINQLACVNANGCQDEWRTFMCCVENFCGPAPSQSCFDAAASGSCASMVSTWQSCTNTVDLFGSCPTWYSSCF